MTREPQAPGRDYSGVSEIPGIRITREAASMLYTRYTLAARACHDKHVLEAGCGAGLGLGYLAKRARSIVGGDYTDSMLRSARKHYGGRVPLVRLDAHALPFRDAAFDVVLLLEAIYYLTRPQEFLRECKRVLKAGGLFLLCSANKEWAGFSPSALSTHYYSAGELYSLLAANDFDAKVFGAFPDKPFTPQHEAIRLIRGLAVRAHLIPSTMKGKEWLKRLFYGRLVGLQEEVDGRMAAKPEPLIPISAGETAYPYKVLYVFATARAGASSTDKVRHIRG